MAGERSILPSEIVLPTDATGLSEIRHELRTYLNHIVGYSEMVLDDSESNNWGTIRRDLDEVLSSSIDLTEHLSNLLHALDDGDRTRCAEIANERIQPALLRIKRLSEHAAADARNSNFVECETDLGRIDRSCQYFLEALDRGLQPRRRSNVNRTPSPPRPDPINNNLRSNGAIDGKGSASILAVDDNEANLILLKRFCERRSHRVTLARTGEEALELLKTKAFDLMILDIMLPGINGFDVLERIHSMMSRRIPVVVLSSLDDMESMTASLRLGAEDFIRKPFNGEVLQARIQSVLERQRAARIPGTNLASDAPPANPHSLSEREIEVLAHLAMGKSNREIGADLFITENTVTRHVSNIFTKANLSNRAEAGVYAVRQGLINFED